MTLVAFALAISAAASCVSLSGLSGSASESPDATSDTYVSAGNDAEADAGVDANVPTSCVIGGTPYAGGLVNAENQCQTCQPTVAVTAWSNVTDGTVCGATSMGICVDGMCVGGCEIANVHVLTDEVNAADDCQSCQPATSTSAWTNLPDGRMCGSTQQSCKNGMCGVQCVIGGTVYPTGTINAANDCQICEPGSNVNAWTNMAVGAGCGTGGSCNGTTCVEAPSCAPGGPGMTNCGASLESCCTSLEVAGGNYYRNYNTDGGADAGTNAASVSAFRLDKYMVTVGRFRQFVNEVLLPDGGVTNLPDGGAGKHVHLNGGAGLSQVTDAGTIYEPGWVTTDDSNVAPTTANLTCGGSGATWTPTAGDQETLPINCVNWLEAYAFCIWDGGFLPSSAEYEYAAGASQLREYPWGSATPTNQYAIYGCNYPGDGGACAIAPVGSAPLGAGPFGQLDMVGELYAWNLDWIGSLTEPCADCAQLVQGMGSPYRVQRGGIYTNASGILSFLTPPQRGLGSPTYHAKYNGFRCARTP